MYGDQLRVLYYLYDFELLKEKPLMAQELVPPRRFELRS